MFGLNAAKRVVEAVDFGAARAWAFVYAIPYRKSTPVIEKREGGRRPCAIEEQGQGTTEYAILVGVLVVMAILAITVFRPHLQELWNAIADGINSL